MAAMISKKAKHLGRYVVLLLVSAMIVGALAVYTLAADLPSMKNVEIVGDYLYWDAVDGAEVYSFGVKQSGGYVDAIKDENGNFLKRQSLNLKEYCEELNIPSGTFRVSLNAATTYIWNGGKYLTTTWHGEYTNVASKPQLAEPTNVKLNDFVLSWDPVPNAESYQLVFARLKGEIPYGSDPTYPEDQRHVFDLTENSIDLKDYFVPDNTHYTIWLIAHAEGFFKSEAYAKTYSKTREWLADQLPDRYIKNVTLATDGTLSWDAYAGANAYCIGIGERSAVVTVGDGIEKNNATGRLSCDLNYYCAYFGREPSEIEVSLSAYSDTVGNNGGCRISGISRITYNYAGVKQLTGEVTYGGESRYGSTISAYISGGISGVPLNYEWQVHEGGVWTKISAAPNGREFKISSADLIGKYIRVSITAQSGVYLGTINGAPKQVGKSRPYLSLETPSLSYTLTKSGGKNIASVKITNYRSDLEYLMTSSPAVGGWPTNGSTLSSGSFDVELGSSAVTYYVYARYAETATREGGTNYIGASVLIPAKSGNDKSATDLIYPEYGTKTPTIYVKLGDSIRVKYQTAPADATANLPKWNSAYGGIVTVTQSNADKTLLIKAIKVGKTSVTAYKPNEPTPWYYGSDYSNMGRTINVVVYDPNDLTTVSVSPVRFSDMFMYVGDVHSLDFEELTEGNIFPDGVNKSKFIYSAYLKTKENMVGMPYVGKTAADGSVTVDDDSVLTAVRAGKATVYLFARTDNSVPQTASGYFAYFDIKIEERPPITVEKVTLNNTSLTLRVGETIKLVATKDPVAAEGTISWSTNNKSVVSVDASGNITAAGKGVATISASCGGCVATCTVEVRSAYCSDHKEVTYSYVDKNNHMWTCTLCGARGTEPHSGYVWSGDDTYHWKNCETYGCGAVIESTKSKHTSSGSNAATCLKNAACDTCKKHYGSTAAHTASSVLLNDKSGHWNTCKTAGCFQKLNFAPHDPDHSGSATVEYAIRCKTCHYVIESQKGHTHVFNKTEANDVNLAAPATCTAKAKYYKTCECGQRGTETFESGMLAAHTSGSEWQMSADEHWSICASAGCGAVIDTSRASHEFAWIVDSPATATESGSRHEVCSVCGYARAAVEIPSSGGDESVRPEDPSDPAITTDNVTADPADHAGLGSSMVWIIVGVAALLVAVVGITVNAIKNKKK